MKSPRAFLRIFLVALLVSGNPADTFAASLTFTLNPPESVLLGSATGGGVNATAQAPGVSDRAPWSGTLEVTIDNINAPTSIQITGGAIAPAITGSWQPLAGGGAGNAPANYAFTATSGITILFAARNVAAQVSQVAPVPLIPDGTGFTFNPAGVAQITGVADYRPSAVFNPGSASLNGAANSNPWGSASLVIEGSTARLLLPVQVTRSFNAGVAAAFTISGMLTASASSIEPIAPSVEISGRKVIRTRAGRRPIRGTATDPNGDLDRVEVKVGKARFRPARGLDRWRYVVRGLREGRNRVRVRAVDSAGQVSQTVTVSIVRRRG